MKKNFIVIFLVFILFSLIFFNSCIGEETDVNIIEKINCFENYQFMRNPIDARMINKINFSIPVSLVDTPDEFNWRNYNGKDWTTPAKDQGNCGSCWDFAAIGTFESIIKIRDNRSDLNLDLSEQYVLSCLPAAANNYGEGCLGGTPYGAFFYMMDDSEEGNNYNGALPESCFPYQASDDILCSEKCDYWIDYLIPISDCGQNWLGFDSPEARDSIKSLIYQNGPISAALNVTTEFINFWALIHNEDSYYPDTDEPWGNRLNHIIMIIGWKDDDSIENGGYWICKNSWGTDWGYDGFFNLEYGGLFIGYYIAWVDYISEDERPFKPIQPVGPDSGKVSINYTYSSSSIDPNGDDVYYLFDWGDNSDSGWIGPYESDFIIEVNHSWDVMGNFEIKVKAKDVNNYESEWSDPLSVSIQKTKSYSLRNFVLDYLDDHHLIFPILRQILLLN